MVPAAGWSVVVVVVVVLEPPGLAPMVPLVSLEPVVLPGRVVVLLPAPMVEPDPLALPGSVPLLPLVADDPLAPMVPWSLALPAPVVPVVPEGDPLAPRSLLPELPEVAPEGELWVVDAPPLVPPLPPLDCATATPATATVARPASRLRRRVVDFMSGTP
jgi:hypothetical protein